MARKSVLTKEQIVECAFDLCVKEGVSNSTIRNIASQLNTSTAPIYTQYPNRGMILSDLDDYISKKLFEHMQVPYTVSSFLNIGIGIIKFTLNHRRLVSEFYFTLNRLSFDFTNISDELIEQMKRDQLLALLEDERLKSLLNDMRIYTYGLIAMICTETTRHYDLDYYRNLLERVGDKLISYHLVETGHLETCQQLFKENKDKYDENNRRD
ncbi:MAG: TetR/AcrR family transcriptional regulator [Clostridiales bacterium]|nr:TetR/AcrR family transcriptional regulator [Clostridiales bacterium]